MTKLWYYNTYKVYYSHRTHTSNIRYMKKIMQDTSITPEFISFTYNLLRFRCLLQENTVKKFFIDNKESMGFFRQAFIHNSFNGETNYELLEFQGDVLLNAAVVEYITEKFPYITSIRWNTRLKHTLISGKVLAKLAIENGFENFLVVSEDLQSYFNTFDDKWDCEDYQAAYEDTVEAVCGVINRILLKYTTRGVGYVACYNLIASFLDEYEISLKYEDLFDPKSRLKEIFDAQGWNEVKGCKLKECIVTYDNNEQTLNKVRQSLNGRVESRVNSTDKFITFGYACLNGHPGDKTLLIITSANNKKNSQQKAADVVINRLARYGISIPIPDAYELKPKKAKKYDRKG